MYRKFIIATGIFALVPAMPVLAERPAAEHPEARPFKKNDSASDDVDTALHKAQAGNKRVVLVMGANWCHDSRGLSGWFATPRFATMLKARYEIVYIDVGQKDRNIDIARRFGIPSIKGTPTVLVLSSSGQLLNSRSAPTWRNAASRGENDIYTYFDQFVPEE